MENRQGEGKNILGNVEAKELISVTNQPMDMNYRGRMWEGGGGQDGVGGGMGQL